MGLSRTSTPLWIKSYERTSNGSLPPMRTSCPPWSFAGVMGGGGGGLSAYIKFYFMLKLQVKMIIGNVK